MTRLRRFSLIFLVAALAGPFVAGTVAAVAQQSSDGTTVDLNMDSVSTLTGESFTFISTIVNNGASETPPLVANLNFVSLDGRTYIDPEDWAPQRTVQVGPVAAGAGFTYSWTVTPVLEGDIAVYVVILPSDSDLASTSPAVASPALHLQVEARRSLNPGGVLPVVLAVPAALLIGAIGLRLAGRIV